MHRAQNQLVTAEHKVGCVPGAVLACVGLSSRLEGAAGVAASLLHASSHSQRQLLELLRDVC